MTIARVTRDSSAAGDGNDVLAELRSRAGALGVKVDRHGTGYALAHGLAAILVLDSLQDVADHLELLESMR